MNLSEKLKTMLAQGVDLTREAAEKAGSVAKELGEKGVVQFEIFKLKAQAQQVACQLGLEVYAALMERGQASLTRESPEIAAILKRLNSLNSDIDGREAELSAKKS